MKLSKTKTMSGDEKPDLNDKSCAVRLEMEYLRLHHRPLKANLMKDVEKQGFSVFYRGRNYATVTQWEVGAGRADPVYFTPFPW